MEKLDYMQASYYYDKDFKDGFFKSYNVIAGYIIKNVLYYFPYSSTTSRQATRLASKLGIEKVKIDNSCVNKNICGYIDFSCSVNREKIIQKYNIIQ